ncbi:hypothetical protein [Pedobacter alpinus]|uniref:CarboxypepD_reg-like domain-containing protein n=1 Tax=Pedobacter alpinus TaxID=1590643 RepID=A0ABW5TQ85_9SPHI
MKKNIVLRILFLLFTFLTSYEIKGQEISKILIIDKNSGDPIDFASLIVNGNVCCSSSKTGEITLNILEFQKGDSIVISKLGYTSTLFIFDFKKSFPPSFTLQPKHIALNEVTFKEKKVKRFKLGNPVTFTVNKFLPRTEDAFATYIPGDREGFVNGINLNLSDALNGITSPFKLEICEITKNGIPGKSLINESLILNNSKKKSWFYIDLSSYNITIPKQGFFVIVSILNENYYEKGRVYWHRMSFKQLPCFALRAYKKNETSYTLIRYKSINGFEWHKMRRSIINLEITAEGSN